jgi:hypothetical protein
MKKRIDLSVSDDKETEKAEIEELGKSKKKVKV